MIGKREIKLWSLSDVTCLRVLIFSLIGAVLLLVPFLGTVPGLHGDEAWAGLRAYEIVGGKYPVVGMTFYTGALYDYALVPGLDGLGFTVGSLRLLTVVAAIISVALLYYLVRLIFDRTLAALTVLSLVAMPGFTADGRVAFEVFALNPILALVALVLLMKSQGANPAAVFWHMFFAGFYLGLGTWNHIIFISVPVALFVTAVCRCKMSIFFDKRLWIVLAGFVVALLPRLIYALVHRAAEASDHKDLHGLWIRLCEWPYLLVQLIHGDLIYQRYTGDIRFHFPNLILPILLLGAFLYYRRVGWHLPPPARDALIFVVTLFFSTLAICPINADRYFWLLLYAAPIFLAAAWREIISAVKFPGLGAAFLYFFIVAQLFRTVENYFLPQLDGPGKIAHYQLGSFEETSDNFIQTDELYDQLAGQHLEHVLAGYFIAMPFQFYNLDRKKFTSIDIMEDVHDADKLAEKYPANSCVIFYADDSLSNDLLARGRFKELSRTECFVVLEPNTEK